MPKRISLFTREVVPFFLQLALLGLAALAIDALLHWLNAVWIGRYLGIPGVLLIIGSFGYSLRKRKLITTGNPATLLRLHERMAWAGSLLILRACGYPLQRDPGLARGLGYARQHRQRPDWQVLAAARTQQA